MTVKKVKDAGMDLVQIVPLLDGIRAVNDIHAMEMESMGGSGAPMVLGFNRDGRVFIGRLWIGEATPEEDPPSGWRWEEADATLSRW